MTSYSSSGLFTTITFKVSCETQFGDSVVVTGNAPTLGENPVLPPHSVRLKTRGGIPWCVSLAWGDFGAVATCLGRLASPCQKGCIAYLVASRRAFKKNHKTCYLIRLPPVLPCLPFPPQPHGSLPPCTQRRPLAPSCPSWGSVMGTPSPPLSPKPSPHACSSIHARPLRPPG